MRRSLTRKERLRSSGEIKELFGSASRVEAQGLRLLFKSNGTGSNRIAVIVKRGSGGAVRRNREKRITREAYRDLKPSIRQGYDLACIVGRFGESYAARRSTMVKLFRRAGLY